MNNTPNPFIFIVSFFYVLFTVFPVLVYVPYIVLFLIIFCWFYRQIKRLKIKRNFSNQINRKDLIIVEEDYKRDNNADKEYRKQFKAQMFSISNNRCANCSSTYNLQLDHFLLPKSAGGNFILKKRDGTYINNCIVLCGICNSSKSNKKVYEFFSPATLENLLRINTAISKAIN